MAMLDRYKKTGGFLQLLNLIETCGPAKQEKFLNIIDDEDPHWSSAIQSKMLSLERILTWTDDILAEVFGQIQELTMVAALQGLGKEVEERMFKYFSQGQQRRMRDLMESRGCTPGEVSAAYVKIIEEVRHMITNGMLRVENFDVTLVIEEDIEDLLAKGAQFGPAFEPTLSDEALPGETPPAPEASAPAASPAASGPSEEIRAEIANLHRKIKALTSENAQLHKKVKGLESRLEQIKKIA